MTNATPLSEEELEAITDAVAERLTTRLDDVVAQSLQRAELKDIVRERTDEFSDADLADMPTPALRATAAELSDAMTANAVAPSDGPSTTGTYAEYRAQE